MTEKRKKVYNIQIGGQHMTTEDLHKSQRGYKHEDANKKRNADGYFEPEKKITGMCKDGACGL